MARLNQARSIPITTNNHTAHMEQEKLHMKDHDATSPSTSPVDPVDLLTAAEKKQLSSIESVAYQVEFLASKLPHYSNMVSDHAARLAAYKWHGVLKSHTPSSLHSHHKKLRYDAGMVGENIMAQILRLDGIETTNPYVKQQRKATVVKANEYMTWSDNLRKRMDKLAKWLPPLQEATTPAPTSTTPTNTQSTATKQFTSSIPVASVSSDAMEDESESEEESKMMVDEVESESDEDQDGWTHVASTPSRTKTSISAAHVSHTSPLLSAFRVSSPSHSSSSSLASTPTKLTPRTRTQPSSAHSSPALTPKATPSKTGKTLQCAANKSSKKVKSRPSSKASSRASSPAPRTPRTTLPTATITLPPPALPSTAPTAATNKRPHTAAATTRATAASSTATPATTPALFAKYASLNLPRWNGPPVSAEEDANGDLLLLMSMEGVRSEDVQVTNNSKNNTLVIRGVKLPSRRRGAHGMFEKTIDLARFHEYDVSQMEATLREEEGVLQIRLPRAQPEEEEEQEMADEYSAPYYHPARAPQYRQQQPQRPSYGYHPFFSSAPSYHHASPFQSNPFFGGGFW